MTAPDHPRPADHPVVATGASRSQSAPWWRSIRANFHSRFARQLALVGVLVGTIVAGGHFVGGLLGWWHAWEFVSGGHRGDPAPASTQAGGIQALPLSIVVLPFANEGGVEDSRFVANLTNDIAVQISRFPGRAVIGRETAAAWSGRTADPREIARELGVRYVLTGTAQRDNETVRLRVALIEGATGTQRWADRFDLHRVDLPQLVDDVVARLGRAVHVEMTKSVSQAVARLPPELASAEDVAMQGWGLLYAGLNRETVRGALALFEKAARMDARSVRAWSGVATSHFYLLIFRWGDADAGQSVARMKEAASRIEALAPGGADDLSIRACLSMVGRDWSGLLADSDLLLQRFPGSMTGHSFRSIALLRLDRFEEALVALERAMALDPLGPISDSNKWRRAFVMYALGRHPEAVEWARQAVAGNRRLPLSAPTLAAALVRDGRAEEGRRVLEAFLQQSPGMDAERLRKAFIDGDGPRFAAARDDMISALREVGLP